MFYFYQNFQIMIYSFQNFYDHSYYYIPAKLEDEVEEEAKFKRSEIGMPIVTDTLELIYKRKMLLRKQMRDKLIIKFKMKMNKNETKIITVSRWE